jgi:UDP-GlcNAc:undecaprenyl-phosphate GlcNAc-1-phosphate transferase
MSRGGSPFAADREHLHHLLLDSGFSVTGVVAIISAATALIAGAAMLAAKAHVRGPAFTIAFLGLWLTYALASRSPERFVARVGGIARRWGLPRGRGEPRFEAADGWDETRSQQPPP